MDSNAIMETCHDALVDTDKIDIPFLGDGEMILQCNDGRTYRMEIHDITEEQ